MTRSSQGIEPPPDPERFNPRTDQVLSLCSAALDVLLCLVLYMVKRLNGDSEGWRVELTETLWAYVAFATVGMAAAGVGGLMYRIRELARTVPLVESLKLMTRGGAVKYRSTDRQGRASTEWELTINRDHPRLREAKGDAAGGEQGGR